MKPRYLVAGLLALVIAVAWLGVVLADGAASAARDPAIPAPQASAAEVEAHTFWDNPFQRMLYLRMAAVEIADAGSDCPAITVNAYSLFGILVDQVHVDCEGIGRVP